MVKKRRNQYFSWKYYAIVATVFGVLFFLVGFIFSKNLSNHLYDQMINEAVTMSKMNQFTISMINKSVTEIKDVLGNISEMAGEEIINETTPEDRDKLEKIALHYSIDEINWFSPEGVIIYSSDGYEGKIMDDDHAIWLLLNNNVDYFFEDIRKDVYSEDDYLFVYLKAPDDSVVQLAINADKITEITSEFSFDRHLAQISQDTRIRSVFVYIRSDTESQMYGEKYNPSFLATQQWNRIMKKESLELITTLNGEPVLEIYVPIEINGKTAGTFFVTYSLAETEQFVNATTLTILTVFVGIFLILGILLSILYGRDQKIRDIAYKDVETDFNNREYLISRLVNVDYSKVNKDSKIMVLVIRNLKRLELVLDIDDIKKRIRMFSYSIRLHAHGSSYYRYAEDTFVLTYRSQSFEDMIRTINNIFEDLETDLDLKIGIIEYDVAFKTYDDILRSIDLAVVTLKDDREGRYMIMDKDIQDNIVLLQKLEQSLRRLSATGFGQELHMEFQPQVDARENTVVGFEALTRWNHPELGYIPPDIIFSIVEKTDFNVALSSWVLTEVLKFINKLTEAGYFNIKVSMNVSTSIVESKGFVHNVLSILEYEGVDPNLLGFEITETQIAKESEVLVNRIKRLQTLGATFSLDDYGLGYSSLTRLRNLDLDILKIDKSFVDDIGKDNRFITEIIQMGYNIGMRMVAEGVETQDQLNWLVDRGCFVIQGYYYSRSLKPKDAIKYIHKLNKNKREES